VIQQPRCAKQINKNQDLRSQKPETCKDISVSQSMTNPSLRGLLDAGPSISLTFYPMTFKYSSQNTNISLSSP